MSVQAMLASKARIAAARRTLGFVRRTSFDVSTPDGRARERLRRAALTTLVSYGARGVTLVTTLVSVPLTLSYLGPERYGMWMTISSIIAMLSFTDFGIGNGLLNSIAEMNGRSNSDQAARFVSSALAMLGFIALGVGLVFALAYPFIPWPRVYNVVSPTAVSEAGLATAAFAACFLLNMPLSVPQQVRVGYQEGYVNGLFVGAGNVLGLVLVLAAIAARAPLPVLVLAMAGAPLLTSLLNAALLTRSRPNLMPRLALITRRSSSALLHTGLLFFVLQIAVAVSFTSNSIIAAQVIGPRAVSEYAVATKLFLIPTTLITLALMPLWPAYREAITRGDARWVRLTFRRSLQLVFAIGVPLSAALVAVSGPLVRLWVGNTVQPSFLLIAGVGIWTVMSGAGNACAMLLNGAQIIRFQVIVASIMSAFNIVLSILLTQRIGVAGVVWGSVIAYFAVELIPLALYIPRLFARLDCASAERVTDGDGMGSDSQLYADRRLKRPPAA